MRAEAKQRLRDAVLDLVLFPFERPIAWAGTGFLAILTLLVSWGVIG